MLVLLALLLVGVFEFGPQGQFGRVLDVLGLSRGTAVGDNAAVSAPAVSTAVGDSAAVSASAAGPCSAGATADSRGRREREADADGAHRRGLTGERHRPCVSRQRPDCCGRGGRDAGADGTRRTADATAPASLASRDRTTQSAAATAASTEPAAIAQPPATLAPPSTRSAQQHAARAPASPREVCGARTQFSLYRCMKTQCSQHRWTSHAQCKRLRATDSVD